MQRDRYLGQHAGVASPGAQHIRFASDGEGEGGREREGYEMCDDSARGHGGGGGGGGGGLQRRGSAEKTHPSRPRGAVRPASAPAGTRQRERERGREGGRGSDKAPTNREKPRPVWNSRVTAEERKAKRGVFDASLGKHDLHLGKAGVPGGTDRIKGLRDTVLSVTGVTGIGPRSGGAGAGRGRGLVVGALSKAGGKCGGWEGRKRRGDGHLVGATGRRVDALAIAGGDITPTVG